MGNIRSAGKLSCVETSHIDGKMWIHIPREISSTFCITLALQWKICEGFLPWRPSWPCDLDYLYTHWFPLPINASYKICI